MKGLIIRNKASLCLHSALCAVNWQFSADDICEIKEVQPNEENPFCVKAAVH